MSVPSAGAGAGRLRSGVGGRGHRRRSLGLAAVGGALVAVSLVYAVVQVAGGGLKESDLAAVLGLPIGLTGLVVAALGLRRPPEGALADLSRGWAATLAAQVGEAEGRQWRQLLGDDTQRINLTFTLRAAPARTAAAPAEGGRLFDGTSTVPDVAAYYRRTRPRRLVVTGPAGAGKTVLALELMLALIEERGADDPVPVRLSLAGWKAGADLRGLLVRRLVEDYDWPERMATALVDHHRVLPVLDGLDEMDRTGPDGTPAPDAPRALAALRALNEYQSGRDAGPLVLTCRTAHYDAVAPRAHLVDAARIEIDAVPVVDAHAYLAQRADRPQAWQPVLDALGEDPTGPLATALSTPWRLCLAATVYARAADPAELLRHATPEELDRHLLARFVPAACGLHPAVPTAHPPEDVHRRLAHLAGHLERASALGTGSGTDLTLHELWPLAGSARVRRVDAVLTPLLVLLPLAPVAPLLGALDDAASWGAWVGVGVLAALLARLGARTRTERPASSDLVSLGTAAARRRVVGSLAVAVPVTLTVVFAAWFGLRLIDGVLGLGSATFLGGTSGDPVLGLVVAAVAAGTGVGLSRGVAQPATAVDPRGIVRGDLVLGLVLAVIVASMVWAAVFTGSALGGWDVPVSRIGTGRVVLGVMLPLTLSVGLAAAVTRSAARRYLVFLLCSRGRLPWRLGAFLDYCCEAGIMRLAGASYQFRHRELQHWLAAHPDPVPPDREAVPAGRH